MKKILVTTDFSDHSKAGLQFAAQLASQNKYALTFINVHHLQTPSAWDSVRMDQYQQEQKKQIMAQLVPFVEKIYEDLNIQPVDIECVVEISILPNACIIEYAEKHHYDYICISTRGAGIMKRILGTITANVINHSKVPVLVVPYDCQIFEIKSILYASDLDDYKNELGKVVSFAKPLNADLELLHFISNPVAAEHWSTLETQIKKITDYPVNIYIVEKKQNYNLLEAIELQLKKMPFSPSLLVMFTGKTKNWFERTFYSGNSVEYAFQTQVPLLIFNKL